MQQLLHHFFDFASVWPYWPAILEGFLLTVAMSAATILIGIPLGLALAVARLLGVRPLNACILVYIDVFRAVPQLVIIVLFYFALPYGGLTMGPAVATVLALSMVLSALAEEIFWASIRAVAKGQWEAGRSTGLGFFPTLVYIILPQAIRMSVPPLTNRAIGISKGTTLGSVVAAPEMLNVTSSLESNTANPTMLTVGAILFVLLFLPLVRASRWLERRLQQRKA